MPLNYLRYFSGNEEPETTDELNVKRRQITLPDSVLAGLGVPSPEGVRPEDLPRGSKMGTVSTEGGSLNITPNPLYDGEVNISAPPQQGQPSPPPPTLGIAGDLDFIQDKQKDVQLVGRDRELGTPLKIETLSGEFIPSVNEEKKLILDVDNLKQEPKDVESFFNAVAKALGTSAVDVGKSLNATMDIMFNTALDIADPNNVMNVGDFSNALNKSLGVRTIETALEKYLPTQDDSFWTNSLPNGLGSVLFFLAGGLAGKGIGMSHKLTSALLGAGTQSGAMFDDTIRAGGTELDAIINFFAGGAIGASEGFMGIGTTLDKIGKLTGRSLIRQILQGGTEEAFQEVSQQLASNLTVQQTYDMSRDLMDGVMESGAVALITGGLVSGVTGAISKLSKQQLSTQDQILLSQAEVNLNTVKEMYLANMKNDVESLSKLGMNRVDLSALKNPNARKFGNIIDKIVKAHNKNGGSSFTSRGALKQGYAVSTQTGNGKEIDGKKITPKDLVDFITENEQLLADPNNFVGTWYNEDIGKTILDVATVVATEAEAQKIGRQNKQDAVFDLKRKEEIPVLPLSLEQARNEQNAIPARFALPVFHFSDSGERAILTDPSKAGANPYSKNDMKYTREPRTFFYSDPRMVQKDHPALRQKKLFAGIVDMRRIYDFSRNEQQYGIDENGVFNIGEAVEQAKANGWDGIRYNLMGGQVLNVFNPTYVERITGSPSLGEKISGQWQKSVESARERLNKGLYGIQFNGGLDVASGLRFVTDVGMVMADKLVKSKTKFSKLQPRDFYPMLLQEYGDQYPVAVRRFSREIFEYVQSIKDDIKNQPLSDEDIASIQEAIDSKLSRGDDDVYIPTGKGAIVMGGDMMGGHLGLTYPQYQALKALHEDVSFKESSDGSYYNLENDAGSITAEDINVDGKFRGVKVRASSVMEEMKGQGLGANLYDAMIDFAINKGAEYLESDNSLSEDSYKQYERLKRQGYEVTKNPNVKETVRGGKTYYTTRGTEGGIFKVTLPKQTAYKRKGITSGWATTNGIAKQISENATTFGNDTIVYMAYDNPYNSIANNWTFQKQLADLLNKELPVGQLEVPPLDLWQGSGAKEVREAYFKKMKKAVNDIKKGKTKEERAKYNLDNLAYKFSIDNAINLAGKIVATAKFSHVNYNLNKSGDLTNRYNQVAKHPTYEAEIMVYNYRPLEEPVTFNVLKKETAGSELGVEGGIKELTGARKEQARSNQLYRIMQQRGLTVNKGQSQLIDAIILHSEGDNTALNQWISENPEGKGEIYDREQHDSWYEKNLKIAEKLRSQANYSLDELLKPVTNQKEQPRDSKGRLPSHPDYEGGVNMYSDPFLAQSIWKGLTVVGKIISRGAKGFTEWSKVMINKIGDWIKPALRSLYAMINQMPNVVRPATKSELNYEQNKSKPDPEKQAEDIKKDPELMGTLPSVTEGYNMKLEHPQLANNLVNVVEAMREEFDVRRRGTISNEELVENAKRKAEKLTDKDIWNINRGDVFNAEDITSFRIYVTDKLLKVSDELNKLNKQSDPILIKQMSDELVNAMRMWQIVRAVGTELGRGVQSFNIPMDDGVVKGLHNLTKVLNDLDPENKNGGKEIESAIEDLIKDKNEDGKKQSKWELLRFIFFNWILQNPLTDIANVFGNFSNLGFHITANIGNLGGMSTLLRGIKNGVKEGSQNALKILHGEQEAISKFTEQSKVDLPSTSERSWKNYLRLLVPTTRLGIEDAFFRAMGRNIEFERMTTKMSKNLSVSPDEIYNAVTSIVNDPDMGKFTRKEYQDLAEYLSKIEDELVFQQELGQIGKAFSKLSRYLFPILPFVTTPTNIMKFGASATPFGALKLLKSDLSAEEKNQIIRRAVAGSVMMTGIATLISQGLMEITGGGSDDPYERDLMAKLGYKPYHLYINTPFGKFGGSYMNVNPLNTPLAVAGDLFDKYRFNKMKDENPAEQKAWYDKVSSDMGTALLALGSSITDQSYLSGVRDLMDALSGRNEDWFTRTLTGYARVGAIQGVQQITGTLDRGSYDTKGRASEQLRKNSPFLTNDPLIESVSSFGEQRQSSYERFPLPVSSIKENTAYNWLEENGLRLKIPSKTTKLGNRELTRKEYEIYSKGVGQIMDKTVNKLWEQQLSPETPEDQRLDLEQLQDKLDATYDKAKKFMLSKIKKMIYEQYQLNEGKK